MKKIVSGLLMGILCVACAKQETTYTIQGEWKDGDGNVIYLKKDLGNKQYEILDSAVVVNGVFKMQKPLGDVAILTALRRNWTPHFGPTQRPCMARRLQTRR